MSKPGSRIKAPVERRTQTRYHVTIKATAFRVKRSLPSFVHARVPVTIVDLSGEGLRWQSREVFYRGELVGLDLPADNAAGALRCIIRVCRTRRISGQYEVAGLFVRVGQAEPAVTGPGNPSAKAPLQAAGQT